MSFGVTDEGFKLKRLEDILQETRESAAGIFGDLVEEGDVVDTTDSSALGRLINLDAEGDAELWEAAQQAYSSLDPNTATGIALDNVVSYGGLFRRKESSSIVPLILKGDLNESVASGSFVGSPSTGTRFKTSSLVVFNLEDSIAIDLQVGAVQDTTLYTINYTSAAAGTMQVEYTSDGDATEAEIIAGLESIISASHPRLVATIVGTTLEIVVSDTFEFTDFILSDNLFADKSSKLVDAVATEPGPLPALAGTVTQIVTPILGWDSVTNPTAASLGRFRETDEELRLRFANTKFTRGINTIDSISSDVSLVEGVTSVLVYENDTNATDANGLPPHSFLVVAVGGTQQSIAQAIYVNKPSGIQSFGNIETDILDSQGIPHTIGFSRPTLVDIFIDMQITTDEDFPVGGEELIREAILAYAVDNLLVSDDVFLSRLYTPINQIPGHRVDSLQIGLSVPGLGTSNITIGFDEIANFIKSNITITAT